MPIIRVDNLGKRYIIGHDRRAGGMFRYQSLRDTLAHQTRAVWQRFRHPLSPNRENTELEEFWALKDVAFEIRPGERVGIIGRNGAGKSTLLKLLSRITEPTTGRIELNGRVASLLEVGTGFHPELTGRENIYLNGAILGMTRAEIKRRFDAIVDFAEVEKFLDTPVKRYSSGMYVRLAFSVAAHLEPEILLVDEVLAVGDAAFQKKCLGKMEDVATNEGRTVLFVSHNMGSVAKLCVSAMHVDAGKIVFTGAAKDAIHHYLNSTGGQAVERIWDISSAPSVRDRIRLRHVALRQEGAKNVAAFDIGSPITLHVGFELFESIPDLRIGFRLVTMDGVIVLTSSDSEETQQGNLRLLPGAYEKCCVVPADFLNETDYAVLEVWADVPGQEILFLVDPKLSFQAKSILAPKVKLPCDERWEGVVRPVLPWSTCTIPGFAKEYAG